jgi:glycosyltransferase involved in cell wall biosynthesis
MNIAIVHDYLHQYGGAEKVVEAWLDMYPKADIYTSFFIPQQFTTSLQITKAYNNGRIHTTWLQHFLPHFLRFYKHLFWLYPIVMSFVTVKNYDTVLISSTYCAKNVRYKNCKKLIHYCHSPVRFLHNLVTETDHKTINPIFQIFIPLFKAPLKWMDLRAVEYLNKNGCIWLANSQFIQETIKQVYNTPSFIVYPPINLEQFLPIQRGAITINNFYLCHGRISFHKRLDIAIQACLELGKPLKISGSGSFQHEIDTLKKQVIDYETTYPETKGLVQFLGRTTNEQLTTLLTQTTGFLFPGKEDFGITPIEVLASGVPIIAYQSGGALEYIEDGVNGVFFKEQAVENMKQAILRFEQTAFVAATIKSTSYPFSTETFRTAIDKLVLDR